MDFNYSDPSYQNVEIEITLDCNLLCTNCDRLSGAFYFGNTNMSLGQIYRFIEEVRCSKHKISMVSIMGGEPLMHPQFVDIWFAIYLNLLKTKTINTMQLITNTILPIPSELKECKYKLTNAPAKVKRHKSFYMAPIDKENPELRLCCNPNGPKECGIVLNTFGYFPCGGGGSIARLFNLPLAKNKLPESLAVWDYNQFCIYCCHADANPTIDSVHCKRQCSATYAKQIEEFKKRKFNFPKYASLHLL